LPEIFMTHMFFMGSFVGSFISALWICGVFINAGRAQLLSSRPHVGITDFENNLIFTHIVTELGTPDCKALL